jgi:hypothetical protein
MFAIFPLRFATVALLFGISLTASGFRGSNPLLQAADMLGGVVMLWFGGSVLAIRFVRRTGIFTKRRERL